MPDRVGNTDTMDGVEVWQATAHFVLFAGRESCSTCKESLSLLVNNKSQGISGALGALGKSDDQNRKNFFPRKIRTVKD